MAPQGGRVGIAGQLCCGLGPGFALAYGSRFKITDQNGDSTFPLNRRPSCLSTGVGASGVVLPNLPPMERSELGASAHQLSGVAQRTFPAATSRSAITISRLSDSIAGLAPFKSCLARMEASFTSSKRLETLSKQSSTVILAITKHSRPRHRITQGQFLHHCRFHRLIRRRPP